MSALETTIVSDWETNKTPIEVIAADLDLEVEAVKAVLLQYSAIYRKQQNGEEKNVTEALNDSELAELMNSYKSLTFSDNEHIRERVLRRLIDEKKGRLDKKPVAASAKNIVKNLQINVLNLNEKLRENRKNKLLGDIGKVLDVEIAK